MVARSDNADGDRRRRRFGLNRRWRFTAVAAVALMMLANAAVPALAAPGDARARAAAIELDLNVLGDELDLQNVDLELGVAEASLGETDSSSDSDLNLPIPGLGNLLGIVDAAAVSSTASSTDAGSEASTTVTDVSVNLPLVGGVGGLLGALGATNLLGGLTDSVGELLSVELISAHATCPANANASANVVVPTNITVLGTNVPANLNQAIPINLGVVTGTLVLDERTVTSRTAAATALEATVSVEIGLEALDDLGLLDDLLDLGDGGLLGSVLDDLGLLDAIIDLLDGVGLGGLGGVVSGILGGGGGGLLGGLVGGGAGGVSVENVLDTLLDELLTMEATVILAEASCESPTGGVPLCNGIPRNVFTDVSPSNVHALNIDCIKAYEITSGRTATTYDPGGLVTRGQLATFAINLIEAATQESIPPPTAPSPFTDTAGNIHENNIILVSQLGIAVGVSGTTFAPNEPVGRGQIASFTKQALEYAGYQFPSNPTSPFTDISGNVHASNINALYAAGLISGTSATTFSPNLPTTRQQHASFLIQGAGGLDEAELWKAPRFPRT